MEVCVLRVGGQALVDMAWLGLQHSLTTQQGWKTTLINAPFSSLRHLDLLSLGRQLLFTSPLMVSFQPCAPGAATAISCSSRAAGHSHGATRTAGTSA